MSFHPNYGFDPGGEGSSSSGTSSNQGQMHSMAMAAMNQANMMAASHFSSMGGMSPYFAQHQAHMQQQQQQAQAQAQLQQQQQQLQAQHQQYMQMYSAGNTNDLLSAHHAAAAAAGGWLAAAHHSHFQPAASRLHPSMASFVAATGGHASSPHLAAAAAAISDGMAAVAESTKKAAVSAAAAAVSTGSSGASSGSSTGATASSGGGTSRKRKPAPSVDAARRRNVAPSEVRVKKFKSVKDLVTHLMQYCQDEFPDRNFAQRALLNLARKISPNKELMTQWARSVITKSANTTCVCIPRPKDGRLTVSRSTSGGTKKVFPQVFLCQVFRWPHIVFHSDIRSADECQNKAPVKWVPKTEETPNTQETETSTESKPKDNLICINPYHYSIAPEAEARFKKHRNKARRAARLKSKMAAANAANAANANSNNSNGQNTTESEQSTSGGSQSNAQNHQGALANSVASGSNSGSAEMSGGVTSPSTSAHNRPPPVASSSETVDEGFSDGEEEQQEVDSEGGEEVDYVAKWNAKAVLPSDKHKAEDIMKASFDPKKLMNEIKFLDNRKTAENGDNDANEEGEVDLSDKFRVDDGVKSIVQGDYLDPEHPYRRALAKQQQTLRSASSPEVLQGVSKEASEDVQVNKSSSVPDLRPSSSEASSATAASATAHHSGHQQSSQNVMTKGSEDPCIADLLDDIRGSFERQFDDDAFEDIHTNANQQTANSNNASGSSGSAFGSMEPSFGIDGVIRNSGSGGQNSGHQSSNNPRSQYFNEASSSSSGGHEHQQQQQHQQHQQQQHQQQQQQQQQQQHWSVEENGSAATSSRTSAFMSNPEQTDEQQQQRQTTNDHAADFSSNFFNDAAARNASVFNQVQEHQQQQQQQQQHQQQQQQQQHQQQHDEDVVAAQRHYSGLVSQSSFSHSSSFDGNNCTGYPAAHGQS